MEFVIWDFLRFAFCHLSLAAKRLRSVRLSGPRHPRYRLPEYPACPVPPILAEPTAGLDAHQYDQFVPRCPVHRNPPFLPFLRWFPFVPALMPAAYGYCGPYNKPWHSPNIQAMPLPAPRVAPATTATFPANGLLSAIMNFILINQISDNYVNLFVGDNRHSIRAD